MTTVFPKVWYLSIAYCYKFDNLNGHNKSIFKSSEFLVAK
jgi:hypothetical protein